MSEKSKIRITGLVAAANRVCEQLKVGIPATEVARFQTYVQETLLTVNKICADAQQHPEQLPTPSRKAYAYLKQLDLSQLPIIQGDSAPPQLLRVANIRAQQKAIQTVIAKVAGQLPASSLTYRALMNEIGASVQHLESLCQKSGVTPAHLTGIAKPFYAWLRFLQEDSHLQSHLAAVQQVQRRMKSLYKPKRKGSSPMKSTIVLNNVEVEFTHLSGLFRYRHHPDKSQFQINEGYIAGDDAILTALAQVVIEGKQSPATVTLRQFALSEEFSEILLAMELMVESVTDTAKGQHYDLSEVFEQVNQTYFDGTMVQPKLSWSATHTRRKFGHYEPARNRVVLSRTLDAKNVPSFVVEFVMYHELLHKKHGQIWVNGRQMVHTPAFRQEERQFELYQQAEDALQQIASQN